MSMIEVIFVAKCQYCITCGREMTKACSTVSCLFSGPCSSREHAVLSCTPALPPPPAAACFLVSVASGCATPTSSGCQRRRRGHRFDGRHRSTGGSLLGPVVSRGCGQCSGRSFSFSLTLRIPGRRRLESHAFAVELALFSCRGVVISIALN